MVKNIMDEDIARMLYPTASPKWKAALEENFGKDFFLETITDRANTFEKVLNLSGEFRADVVPYSHPKNKRQRMVNAKSMLELIAEVWNEGTFLDFENQEQGKHYVWAERKKKAHVAGGWVFYHVDYYSMLDCPGMVYFKNAELAKLSWQLFPDLYFDLLPE